MALLSVVGVGDSGCGCDLSWSLLTLFSWLSQVHYTFNKVLMLQEPLLVVAAFYILFFTVIIYVRLDFSITKVLCSLPLSGSPCAPMIVTHISMVS